MTHHSLVFHKREATDTDHLVSPISRAMGAFIRDNLVFFASWDRIVTYYDGGQKELTNVVNSVFNAHLTTVEVRKVIRSDYSPSQAADLCCTLALPSTKIETIGLSASERDFFSTLKDSAERAFKKGYFKTIGAKRFGSSGPRGDVAEMWQDDQPSPIGVNNSQRVRAGQPHNVNGDPQRSLSVPRFPWYY